MFNIFDKIDEYLKNLCVEGITDNIQKMFIDMNQYVDTLVDVIGKEPKEFNSNIFSLIENVNKNAVLPVCSLIISAVLCVELINMVMQRNNMHDFDTIEFFKYFIKSAIAVFLVSHAFEFTMAAFDVTNKMISKVVELKNIKTTISNDELIKLSEQLKEEDLSKLLGILTETTLIRYSFLILGIIVFLIAYGRMIEIYIYCSISSLPFATLGNKEWGQIGTNYIKGLFALALQGVLIVIILSIYTVLIQNIKFEDLHKGCLQALVYGVLLGSMLLKSGQIAKSILNAH